jgi:hypothetical protein
MFDHNNNEKSIENLIKDFENAEWKNKAYSEFIRGANTIGLINFGENGYSLSKIGEFCLEYFRSIGINSLIDLDIKKSKTSGTKTIYSEFPHIAKFLQLIYYQNLDFKKFIVILQEFDKNKITSREIIDKLINKYPNLFINFFIKKRKREKVTQIFLNGNKEDLTKDYNMTCEKYGHYNFFFSFRRHLVHLGILSSDTSVYYKKMSEMDVDTDLWILNDDILI